MLRPLKMLFFSIPLYFQALDEITWDQAVLGIDGDWFFAHESKANDI